jgi:methylmalonyl-CoA mutase
LPTLESSRGASAFEDLRLATEKSGKTPKVFMLTIGNLAMRLARSQFSATSSDVQATRLLTTLDSKQLKQVLKQLLPPEQKS